MTALPDLGWDSGRDTEFAPYAASCVPARVARPDKGSYALLTATGPLRAEVSGALRHAALDSTALPTVGDWVAVREPGVIEAVLPRRSAFVRHGATNATVGQVLAANVDLVFVVVALSAPPNLRRLERFLALAWESGAQPAVLLTKADLWPDLPEVVASVTAAAPGCPVHAVSVVEGVGVEDVRAHLTPGRTVVLLGASGVGKSTLANALLGADHLATKEIREVDGKGRHTTTHRELIPLPGGAVLIDTPGLRGLMLWDAEEGLEKAFADVETLIPYCRFNDCAHRTEPGCAVLAALDAGTLEPRRWESYQKLQRELHHVAAKQDVLLRIADRDKWKQIHKEARARNRPQTR
ncbi:MAG TPA: ribosome small subunit-dependent GTPase A [Frankiaceae bacterium]|nr:ribosome small subunit-dependent GTPase A [Frankiaceae bacterium]